jgi:hypothetical protein
MRMATATTDVAAPVRIVDAISRWMRLEITPTSQIRSGTIETMAIHTPLGSFDGWLHSVQLPKQRKCNGDVCSCTGAKPRSKYTKFDQRVARAETLTYVMNGFILYCSSKGTLWNLSTDRVEIPACTQSVSIHCTMSWAMNWLDVPLPVQERPMQTWRIYSYS